jgi:glycosyltransferase involved in cell wall biosynthesis
MKFSVCIATYGRPESLAACLAALSQLEPVTGGFEVVVADDASPDEAAVLAVVDAAAVPVRLVRRSANGGPGAARNSAWRAATGEWVVFTDDDCRPRRDWLASLARTVGGGAVDLVQGRTVPDPSRQHLLGRPLVRSLSVEAEDGYYQTCNIAYRRSLLAELDGFDESFRSSGEDTDLAWRARAAGACTAFKADAVVEHAVTEAGWRQDLRSRQRWADIPALVRRHPELRRLAWQRFVYRRSHAVPLALLGALPFAAAAGRPGRVAWLTAVAAVAGSDVVRAGSPDAARRALATRPGDVYETLVLLRSSAQARTVLL